MKRDLTNASDQKINNHLGKLLFPENYGKDSIWKVEKSNIHGQGVFSKKRILENEMIGVCIIQMLGFVPMVTAFGSKINHSYKPNTALRYDYTSGTHNLYATKELPPDTEIVVDYRFTPVYISGPLPHYK